MDLPALQFESLQYFHRDMMAAFQLHQELLLCDEVELAEQVLRVFDRLLQVHIDQEERRLFPLILRVLELDPEHASPLIGEHERLSAMVRGFQTSTGKAIQLPKRERRRAVIGLLESHAAFKTLFAQHDDAEHDLILPSLTRVSGIPERRTIIPQLVGEWRNIMDCLEPTLAEARQRVG